MPSDTTLTEEELERGAKRPYHHVHCKQLEGLRIKLTENGQKDRKSFAILGLSSKETIMIGMKAVDASPFQTVFVLDEESGKVLFALSKNEEYVNAARKKDPKPPPDPDPVPPTSFCCQECKRQGGYACSPYPDGSCICWGVNQGAGGGGSLDDSLETLAVSTPT